MTPRNRRSVADMLLDSRPIAGGEPTMVTIPGVELLAAGHFHASTGEVDVTREHLQAMVEQHNDPAVRDPILKITHAPSMFGRAVWGRVVNLRLNDNGTVLIGDIVCPEGLAELIPVAWPDRSVEFNFDVPTQTGITHAALLQAVSVLGEDEPAVQGLEAIAVAWGVDPGTVEPIAAARFDRRPIVLSTTIDRLYGAYSSSVPIDDRPEPYMWTREIWLDDNTAGFLISEGEDSGRLFRIPFTIQGEDVTFGEPEEVVTEYVAASAARSIEAASGHRRPDCLARDIPRNPTGGGNLPSNNTDVINPDEGGARMDPEQLRQLLGLPADATDEQVTAALADRNAAYDAANAGNGGDGGGNGNDPAPAPTDPPADPNADPDEGGEGGNDPAPTDAPQEPEAIAAAIRSGAMVVVDAGALRQLQADAGAGREARTEQLTASRNELLGWAIRTGRIAPASRDHYANLLSHSDASVRQNTDTLLRNLPVVLPADNTQIGHNGSPEVAMATDHDALYESVFGDDNVVPMQRGA